MALRMYKYRLYPSRKQKERIINSFKVCKAAYNELLALNKDSYQFGDVTLGKFDYNKYLTGKYREVHSQVLQNVSDRTHKAFQNFFRRVKDKSCKKKGFPRFKSRINSMTYPQSGFKFVTERRLYASKIGNIPIVLHRIPKGKIKTLTIKVNRAGQWFAIFSCEIEALPIKHSSTKKIGLDVGLESFATLSNGSVIENPRFLIKSEKKLKRLQRRLSKKKKGSINRRKARYRLARQYLKVINQRTDFLHKLSHKLTKSYSFIAVEDLNIKNMIKNHWLAKSITDASWNSFVQMLSYKAITCGGQLVKINPKNTSKTCSECGTVTEMPLSKREFLCPSCGFVCHRDLNASINILTVGMDYAKPNACRDAVRPSLKARVVESGTICDNS